MKESAVTGLGGAKGTALITGAGSGIGKELAELLAAQGHSLVLVGRSGTRLEQVATALRASHGALIWTVPTDLSTPGAARALFEFTSAHGLVVDTLVNNAGVGIYGEHTDLPTERVAAMLQLNITALVELSHLYGAEMKLRGTGRILNVASTAAYQPTPFMAAYGASKAFVLSFSEAMAMELGDHGVTVTCLSPGPTDTPFFGEMDATGVNVAHLAKGERHSARTVAEIGLKAMEAGELSTIVGVMNNLRALAGRFAPRFLVARISKGIMGVQRGAPPALPSGTS